MVSRSGHWSSYHLPARFLRLAGGQEVVGAVLQAALARHHRHLPEGPGPGPARTQEDHSKAGQENGHEVRDCTLYTVLYCTVLYTSSHLSLPDTAFSPTSSASGDSHQD